jgi:hypothetical protein
VGEEVLGTAAKVEVSKESTTIVGDGSTEEAVKARVRQIRNLITETEQDYEKEKLNERVARLSGGVAIIQVSFIGRVYGHLRVQVIVLGSDSRLAVHFIDCSGARGAVPAHHLSSDNLDTLHF